VIYFAAWLSWVKNKAQDFRFGILPFGLMLAVIAFVLLKQPDTKSFILITITGAAMLFVSGVPLKYLLGITFGIIFLLGAVVYVTPYLQERVKTFINPAQDSQGSSYQIEQSLIALGSGGVFGRGFGQSVQKFWLSPGTARGLAFCCFG